MLHQDEREQRLSPSQMENDDSELRSFLWISNDAPFLTIAIMVNGFSLQMGDDRQSAVRSYQQYKFQTLDGLLRWGLCTQFPICNYSWLSGDRCGGCEGQAPRNGTPRGRPETTK
jgi:hypothetical protein